MQTAVMESLESFFECAAAKLSAAAAAESLPAIVVATSRDGELLHFFGAGELRIGSGQRPDANSIFRIASMTKSFTAAAILLLRDRGALALDDPIVRYLPWTASIGVPRGTAPIAIRDLLTMNAGLPTDDPWGDRQESTPIADFDALVAGGLSFIRGPRTGFTYSNLSYALLGRIVTLAAGVDYREFVARELLAPLGMKATCFDTEAVDEQHRAHGYSVFDAGPVPEPPVRPGAFSPMGGLHSSLRDLARWVDGFAAACKRDDSAHPLRAATRREMQEGRTLAATEVIACAGEAPAKALTRLYAYGLAVDIDSELGTFVHHSGGYPGFGSHMRWHPASGWSIIALSSRTYAPLRTLAAALLNDAVAHFSRPFDPLPGLWPATRAAMDTAEALLDAWDDALADAHFALNVDLDRPRNERRAELERIAGRIGRFTRSPHGITSDTAADVAWTVRGEHGQARLEVLLTPESAPKIQLLRAKVIEPADGKSAPGAVPPIA